MAEVWAKWSSKSRPISEWLAIQLCTSTTTSLLLLPFHFTLSPLNFFWETLTSISISVVSDSWSSRYCVVEVQFQVLFLHWCYSVASPFYLFIYFVHKDLFYCYCCHFSVLMLLIFLFELFYCFFIYIYIVMETNT